MGQVLVALGTSTPEISVAINAALGGHTELILGNAIGANIANIGLVLGVTLLMSPFALKSSLYQREFPLIFLAMLFSYSLMLDSYLSLTDGCLLLLTFIILMGYFIFLSIRVGPIKMKQQGVKRSLKSSLFSVLIGGIVLPLCGYFMVKSLMHFALLLGINDLVAGLTIVAIGTTLPELLTSFIAIYKGQGEIAIGNILGSNMFNLLLIMAFPSLISPAVINRVLIWRDVPLCLSLRLFFCIWDTITKTKWNDGMEDCFC